MNKDMLNKELFDDPKDAEIARLKMCIENFKEYDNKRKKYYADKMKRLGELEAFIQEIECENKEDLESLVAKQKIIISKLNKTIQSRKILNNMSEEDAIRIVDFDRINEENKRLKKEINLLYKEISKLSYKLINQ